MSDYYQRHVFFCTNLKPNSKKCCQEENAEEMCAYTKKRLNDLEQHGPGKIRVSKSGCLGRCESGPCIVIYPDQTWYTYHDTADIDKIIENDLQQGKPVPELLIQP